MAVNRRTLLLASVLVLAIVVAVVWTSGGSSTPTPAQPARPAAARSQPGQEAEAAPAPVGRVNLDLLTSARQQPVDVERNPFRFKPRAPAPPPVSANAPTASKPAEQAPVFAAPPPMPVGPPPPPPIPLKFIGIMTQGKKRVAVLTDGKSAPQGGEEGAIILGQYRILKIGNESIEMAYVDGRGRTTIRLTGQ
jgi:hypothetical protein